MNFLQKVFGWSSDAKTSEKVFTVLASTVVIVVLLWLIIASYGIGNTDIAMVHKSLKHPGQAALIATLIYAGAFFWLWYNFTDMIPWKISYALAGIIFLLLISLGVAANTNFFNPYDRTFLL